VLQNIYASHTKQQAASWEPPFVDHVLKTQDTRILFVDLHRRQHGRHSLMEENKCEVSVRSAEVNRPSKYKALVVTMNMIK
jgi:hypothetical protein